MNEVNGTLSAAISAVNDQWSSHTHTTDHTVRPVAFPRMGSAGGGGGGVVQGFTHLGWMISDLLAD